MERHNIGWICTYVECIYIYIYIYTLIHDIYIYIYIDMMGTLYMNCYIDRVHTYIHS